MKRLIQLSLSVLLLLSSSTGLASGNFSGPNRDSNGNIIPTPKGEACVEPIDVMRKNHMEFLLHKRDQTMHEGIRTKQYSLVECINCHATPGEDGVIARITDEKHFCASCHHAASVKLDCFECHADRPVEAFSDAGTVESLPSIEQTDLTPYSVKKAFLKNN